MPEPIPGKGYGADPTPGLPLSVPYGVPQRPGFPAQTIIPPGYRAHVAPGCIPPHVPNTQPTLQVPGSMLGPNGVLLPPPNLPANFAQMQADFQQQYMAKLGQPIGGRRFG